MMEEHLAMISTHLGLIARNLKRIADHVEGVPAVEKAIAAEDVVAPVIPATTEASVKRARRTKAEIAADKQKNEDAAGIASTGGIFGDPTSALTELDMRNLAKTALDVKGWQPVEDLVKEFAKTGKIKDVQVKDYPELAKKLTAMAGKK